MAINKGEQATTNIIAYSSSIPESGQIPDTFSYGHDLPEVYQQPINGNDCSDNTTETLDPMG